MLEPLKLADIKTLLEMEEERTQVAELDDVSRWIELALSGIPDLAVYHEALLKIEEYFEETGLEGDDLQLWRAYRDLFAQRFSRVYDDILEITDVIATDLFNYFVHNPLLRNVKSRFSECTIPFTFLGKTEDYYFTYTHDAEHPVAVISIPQGLVSSAWNWLAIPHEIGHNIFAHFINYEKELLEKVTEVLSNHSFKINMIDYPHRSSGKKIMETIWRTWIDELMADLFGVLFTGPAFVMDRQEDATRVSSRACVDVNISLWDVQNMVLERHPTFYLRPLLGTKMLRILDFPHLAEILDHRWFELYPNIRKKGEIIWVDEKPDGNIQLFSIPVDEMLRCFDLILPVMLKSKMKSLGGAPLIDIIHFDELDFVISTVVAQDIINQTNKFARFVKPRHILAASRIAFESDPKKAEIIHTSATQALLHFKNTYME